MNSKKTYTHAASEKLFWIFFKSGRLWEPRLFFRIWCLYLSKLCLITGISAVVLSFVARDSIGFGLCAAVSTGLAISGALLAIPYVLLRWPMGCPVCQRKGELVLHSTAPMEVGVDCAQCGVVYADPLRDFRVRVDRSTNDDSDE